jgi:hypothetical protein
MDTKKDGHDIIQTRAINDDADYSMNDLDFTGVTVKSKWRGTPQDKLDMKILGRNQVLRVRRYSSRAVLVLVAWILIDKPN